MEPVMPLKHFPSDAIAFLQVICDHFWQLKGWKLYITSIIASINYASKLQNYVLVSQRIGSSSIDHERSWETIGFRLATLFYVESTGHVDARAMRDRYEIN